MDSGSVSKSQVILEIKGKIKIKCELKRHLSPSLVALTGPSTVSPVLKPNFQI